MSNTRSVVVAGASIAVEERGSGPALLFVHGYPLDRSLWRHQLGEFASWRRIAPDLRGFGASAAAPPEPTLARYADDLAAVLDALGVEQAVVCGLSMGGYITFEFLRRHRARVRGLILMDTKAEADGAEGKKARDQAAALAEEKGAAAIADGMLPKLLAAGTAQTQPTVVVAVREMMLRASVPGIVAALRAMRDRPDSTDLLPEIAVPTLALCGADDVLTPPAGMKTIAERVRGARYVEVAGAGHLSPLEQPTAVNRAVAGFLSTFG